MDILQTTKIIRTGTSLSIIIPKPILKAYGWERGDRVIFTLSEDNFLLVRRPSDIELKELRKINEAGEFKIKHDGTLIKEINV